MLHGPHSHLVSTLVWRGHLSHSKGKNYTLAMQRGLGNMVPGREAI